MNHQNKNLDERKVGGGKGGEIHSFALCLSIGGVCHERF